MASEGGIVGYSLELSSANIFKDAWKGCCDLLPVSTQLRTSEKAPECSKRIICVHYAGFLVMLSCCAAQAVAVSEAQALVITSPVLQAEVRQVITKLQSQYAVLTDKLRPHDSSVARLQAAHDALAPAIQQWKSAMEECAAVRAQVNAAPLETLHTDLQQHWANLRQALTT